ncbi:MAG: sigma-54 interaction domain-containing protein [Saprospiraceae bacterium]
MNIQSIKQRFGIIGRSAGLENALNTAARVSATDLTVLITGESGVGKEVFSNIIHSLSPRKHGKFIAVNCGAIPEGTINSELFGHTKGAFTGAASDRKGYFETVSGGTIFLDEIGEMPLETQTFLLRVLENGEITPVGSSKTIKVDVRIVAATNVNLQDKIRKGKFREDLFYRLSTVPITVPPLRERKEDIYLLFRKFVNDFAEKYRSKPIQLDERAVILLENYEWRGNIRELRNVAEQISVLSQNQMIGAEELMDYMPNMGKRNLPSISSDDKGTSFEEREILYKVLFDMKKDLSDLKAMFFDMVEDNNLRMPDIRTSQSNSKPSFLPSPSSNFGERRSSFSDFENYDDNQNEDYEESNDYNQFRPSPNSLRPIIIGHQEKANYNEIEEVEENLSLKDMERDLIEKALKKHKGKRKDAAAELGISERTLYRKIQQYEIEE